MENIASSSEDSESALTSSEDEEYSTDWTSTDEEEDLPYTDVEEVAFRRRVRTEALRPPSTSKPLESTSAGRPKRRIMRKRTLFEKYCCEVSTFTVLTVLSLAYYTARYYRESKSLNPEASLSEKQRIRYWDWPDPSTHKHIGHNWNHAITTMWLPDDDEVAFQLGTGSEHDLSPEGPGHVKMPEFFFQHTIFGLSAHNPADDALRINAEAYNELAHEELRVDLQNLDPKPDYILDCIIEGRAIDSKHADGFAVAYRNTLPEKTLKRAERAVLLQARIYGQMGMYKWFVHQYGHHPRDHAVIIQKVKPTGGAMYRIKTSGPVYRVRWRDTTKAYQVEGQGQHMPKVEQYPRRRPKRTKNGKDKDKPKSVASAGDGK